MKTCLLFISVGLLAASQAQQEAASPLPKKSTFRNAVTHDQLSRQLQVAEQSDPMKTMVPSKGEDPSKKNMPSDFLLDSDMISFNGYATFVPKRAILAAPSGVKSRIGVTDAKVKIIGWEEFQTLNRGWITAVEVDRSQAEGNKPLAEDLSKHISKSTNLVVAVLQGGPISVLPPKPPVESSQSKPSKP